MAWYTLNSTYRHSSDCASLNHPCTGGETYLLSCRERGKMSPLSRFKPVRRLLQLAQWPADRYCRCAYCARTATGRDAAELAGHWEQWTTVRRLHVL